MFHERVEDQITSFHSSDYVNFLKIINPDNMVEYTRQLLRCFLVDDRFDLRFTYGQYYFDS